MRRTLKIVNSQYETSAIVVVVMNRSSNGIGADPMKTLSLKQAASFEHGDMMVRSVTLAHRTETGCEQFCAGSRATNVG
jgi:hypothetical protein